jgi:hypothetical protein
VSPIRDLALVEVRRVHAAELPETGLRVDSSLRAKYIREDATLQRITLSGTAKWISEVTRQELNSYPIIVRCDRRDAEVFSLGPYISGDPIPIELEESEAASPASGTALYTIYLPETSRYTSRRVLNAKMPTYDLRAERIELCIRLAGGAMHGAYGESNEVRVLVGGQ